MTYRIIDLFAGPGGLGEGFSSFEGGKKFNIAVSAEMDEHAHRTLTLRSWYRHARRNGDARALKLYYDYCNNPGTLSPVEDDAHEYTKQAAAEALQVVLGTKEGNKQVDEAITAARLREEETIVIGGPPCQAYSLVGRARNKGKEDYVPEADSRHFLYKEYLRILATSRPVIFVMENVKGILSSKVDGGKIFDRILEDIQVPGKANRIAPRLRYRIRPIVAPAGDLLSSPSDIVDPHSFIVRSELFGIPQARHRVILLGIREDLAGEEGHFLVESSVQRTVAQVIGDLPPLRGHLHAHDDLAEWSDAIIKGINALIATEDEPGIPDKVISALRREVRLLGKKVEKGYDQLLLELQEPVANPLASWYYDSRLHTVLNHTTRSHMGSDLLRYFFAATFAKTLDRSPKGIKDFCHESLRPNHDNWESGKFSDRFRVQMADHPSTTVTSHIAKDGHYFIHPDPQQCRSLTVREAARLQTFPDNYYFQGNRTQQYHQVGNAVPPYLALQIAEVVSKTLASAT